MTTQTPDGPPGIGGIRHGRGVTLLRGVTPDRVVGAARSAARAYGSATARSRPLPEFLVIGAYPRTGTYDECTTVEDRPRALKTIPKVPLPRKDPVYGVGGPLSKLWKGAK